MRQPKSAHRKTQTPIVAKQISSKHTDISSYILTLWESAFLPNSHKNNMYAEKRYIHLFLKKRENIPMNTI